MSDEDGRTIRAGYDAELDELAGLIATAQATLVELERRERERSGIRSLKVGFNKVFGYYIEVTKSNLKAVPADYLRKQTLANGERFVTPELKDWEARILRAEERIGAREREVFAAVVDAVGEQVDDLLTVATALAEADVLATLAEHAVQRRYVRPELDGGATIAITGGRHPVVELALDAGAFVPNDTMLTPDERLLLITGPNMAGKSTYLRQVALIVLLAQIGSFVPAERARIGLVDRICTRVGAQDDLAAGASTFLVEMAETAAILGHATPRSLVILDEIGRGTSTLDGLAIARAVMEDIHDRVRARTLFATHFHELTELAGADATAAHPRLHALRAYHLAALEDGGDVVFLRRVVPGAADRSYGIHVARLAGLPAHVTTRAEALLSALEEERSRPTPTVALVPLPVAAPARVAEEPASYDARCPVCQHERREAIASAIERTNLAATTPMQALNLLFELRERLAEGGCACEGGGRAPLTLARRERR